MKQTPVDRAAKDKGGHTIDDDYLALDDDKLLAQCRVETYRASGPGGQHRNKVSSAVRLLHKPSAISAHGDDSRSQHENKRLALKRLRMEIALGIRHTVSGDLPAALAECLILPKKAAGARPRLDIGRKDARFWPMAQRLLDVFDAAQAGAADAAKIIGIGSANLVSQLKKDRHLFAAANQMRKKYQKKPLN